MAFHRFFSERIKAGEKPSFSRIVSFQRAAFSNAVGSVSGAVNQLARSRYCRQLQCPSLSSACDTRIQYVVRVADNGEVVRRRARSTIRDRIAS